MTKQPKMRTNWVPCQTTEFGLKKLKTSTGQHVIFQQQCVRIADIKRTTSLLENTRFSQVLDEEHVTRIAISMEAGKPIPPIILTVSKEVLAGNHRLAASDLIGDEAVEAYVLQNADKFVKEVICRTDNAGHGLGLSREEYIQQALRLIESGMAVHEAATSLSLKTEVVKEHHKSATVRKQLERLGINTAALNHSTLLVLSEVNGDTRSLEELGRTAAARRMTTDEAKLLVDVAKEESDPAKRVQKIKDARTKMMTQPRGRNMRPVRRQLVMAFLERGGLYEQIMKGNHGLPLDFDDIEFLSDEEAKKIARNVSDLNDYLQAGLRKKGLRKARK